jgi:hypothetical protein
LWKKYEENDELAKKSKGKEVTTEMHRGRIVQVTKQAVFEGNEVIGVQGIFWYLDKSLPPTDEPVWIDWERCRLHVHGDPTEYEIQHSWQYLQWRLFDCLYKSWAVTRAGTAVVTYREICEKLYGEEDLRALNTGNGTKKIKDKIGNLGDRLSESLKQNGLDRYFTVDKDGAREIVTFAKL